MKGTTLVIIVAAVIIIILLASVYIYIGLPVGQKETATSIVTAPPETASLAYIISFSYAANPIIAGQNQSITIEITQGSYPIASVSGALYVVAPNAPSRTYYQTFGYTTDANGEAMFSFPVARNATSGNYLVFATIFSIGELIQNTSSSYEVVAPS